MKLWKKLVAVSALVLASMGAVAGVASAAPVPAPAAGDRVIGLAPGVDYISYADGLTAIVTGAGTLTYINGQYHVLDAAGKIIF